MWKTNSTVLIASAALFLSACGGGGNSSPQIVGDSPVRGGDSVDVGPVVCDVSQVGEDGIVTAVEYLTLIGSIHEHSGFSDGEIGTTPADYYQAAKDNGLNFMTSSEHSDNQFVPLTLDENCASERLPECLILPTADSPAGGFDKWGLIKDIAEAASDENFTAIRGFEWTSDRFGHANIYFSTNQLNAKTTDGYAGTMEGLWEWFNLDASLGGGNDGLLVFNHPGREDALKENIDDPAFTFNDFELRANVADRVVGIEMFGKSRDAYDMSNLAPPEGWYARALDRGWRLGPTGSEDEHGTEWAKPIRAKTVLLAEENSLEGLRAAMQARRMYALAQHNGDIRLAFTADGLVMGSNYRPPEGTQVILAGSVTAAFPQGGRIEMVSNNGELITTANSASFTETVAVGAEERWYYIRVFDAEGNAVAYSAPIWLQAGDDDPACSI